jgi:hypothetical protein
MLAQFDMGNKNFEINRLQNYMCIAAYNAPVVHDCGLSEERIFKTRSHWFCECCEIHILFDTVDVVTAVGMCALGRTVAQVTLSDVFVVMSVNVWFEIFLSFAFADTKTLVSFGHQRTCICVALKCCRTLTCWNLRSGKCM